ncbi:aldo/keto reductase [Halobacteriovorax sp. GB3]|uniref:aldo/keto reductase n=1 Tax=Halobacteriovorax sp. GB3 TaxID=2719615 RepID=UPI002360A60E|nr:aldo/keto reductase [Halobacteriovorax sp. GB3]MDD0853180.1 aldo/keto reductase [Halobacteriovorax sp. GB3]
MTIQSKIGFGAYRISIRSNEHYLALKSAVEAGLDLIDTSANYTNGESEKLIGKVLKEFPDKDIKIVTKGGYIQGDNIKLLEVLNSEGKAKEDLVEVNDQLYHSIHPEFLQSQIDLSYERLEHHKIDFYLLHNPEYYFYEDNASQDEFYRRIEKAFLFLEKKVESGEIENYGISSNGFVLSEDDKQHVSLKRIIEVANKIGAKRFKAIQFPANLIEVGAFEKDSEGLSLIDRAKQSGLITFSNRPLNAFKDQRLVRLASYEKLFSIPTIEEVRAQLDHCLNLMEEKFQSQYSDDEQRFKELPLVVQLTEIFDTLPTPDAVDQVYFEHFFPLIAKVWGGEGLSAEESAPFYHLYELNQLLARKNMGDIGKSFFTQAQNMGLIQAQGDRPLSVIAIEYYLNNGIDHVLVGMKKIDYVNQLKDFF